MRPTFDGLVRELEGPKFDGSDRELYRTTFDGSDRELERPTLEWLTLKTRETYILRIR